MAAEGLADLGLGIFRERDRGAARNLGHFAVAGERDGIGWFEFNGVHGIIHITSAQ